MTTLALQLVKHVSDSLIQGKELSALGILEAHKNPAEAIEAALSAIRILNQYVAFLTPRSDLEKCQRAKTCALTSSFLVFAVFHLESCAAAIKSSQRK